MDKTPASPVRGLNPTNMMVSVRPARSVSWSVPMTSTLIHPATTGTPPTTGSPCVAPPDLAACCIARRRDDSKLRMPRSYVMYAVRPNKTSASSVTATLMISRRWRRCCRRLRRSRNSSISRSMSLPERSIPFKTFRYRCASPSPVRPGGSAFSVKNKKPAHVAPARHGLASSEQDFVAGSRRVRMQQAPLRQHVTDQPVVGRQQCFIQILDAEQPEFLHAAKGAAGVVQVGQKHDALQGRHPRPPRRVAPDGGQDVRIGDPNLPAGQFRTDGRVPQVRHVRRLIVKNYIKVTGQLP